MPALTIAAAWRYALTGVGAAMAPGSQKWNGTSADFDRAPTSRSTTAVTVTTSSGGGSASSAEIEYVWWTPRAMMPTSIASPPNVVTRSACMAARRFVELAG